MLRTASGLLAPDHGAIVFDGDDISGMPPHRIAARGLVHVPGGHSVFPALTVAENLRMGAWLYRRDRAAGARRRPTGSSTCSRRCAHDSPTPAADLSGGQQRMLAVAMSLLVHPKMLLIDELSLGLAPAGRRAAAAGHATAARDGVTVIIVEQSVDTALRAADRSFFLEKGTIRLHGLTAELYDRPDLLRSIFLEGMASATGTELARVRADARAEVDTAGVDVVDRPVVLAAQGVTKRFGGLTALDDVSLELHDGEILGLIGPNGAGKTTLFDVVSGFLVPNAGRVTLDGVDLTRSPPAATGAARPGSFVPERTAVRRPDRVPDAVRRARPRAHALGPDRRRAAAPERAPRRTPGRPAGRRADRDRGARRLTRQVRVGPLDRDPAPRRPRVPRRHAAHA